MTSADLFLAASRADGDLRSLLTLHGRRAALAEEINSRQLCPLHALSTRRVPYSLPSRNDSLPVAVVGEAPGRDEDAQGRPFVGRSGRLLDQLLLDGLGAERSQVAAVNTICCRPPANDYDGAHRLGAPAACEPFLWRQLELTGAWAIVATGGRALSALTSASPDAGKLPSSIRVARDRPFWVRGFLVFTTYHPAYALRNPDARQDILEDLAKLRQVLDGSLTAPEAPVTTRRNSFELPTPAIPPQTPEHLEGWRRQLRKRGWGIVYSHFLGYQIMVTTSPEIAPPGPWMPTFTLGELWRINSLARLGDFTLPQLRAVGRIKQVFGNVEVVS